MKPKSKQPARPKQATNPKQPYDVVAADISKDELEVLSQDASLAVANSPEGFARIAEIASGLDRPLVVFEATGGYERPLLEFLAGRRIPFALLNAARVRAFAKSEGVRAKTDPIDARMIRRFALEKAVQPAVPAGPSRRKLADLLDRRSQLAGMLAEERTRLQKSAKLGHGSIRRIARALEREIAAVEKRIRGTVDREPSLRAALEVMVAVVGVGEVTAWALLAYLGEIAAIRRTRLAALAGVAPFNDDSGKSRGKRRIQGGRAKVRRCLYMAATSAAVHNPVIRPYVERLMARGKTYKCAIVAAMRKLLIHLQSLLRKHEIKLVS